MSAASIRASVTDIARRMRGMLGHAPRLVTLVLSVAIVAQLAGTLVTLTADSRIAVTAGADAARRARGARAGSSQLTASNSIINAHLFGRAPTNTMAAATVASPRQFVLTGIIATEDPGDGFAILGTRTATARVLHTGSQAAPGVVLAKVYPHHVVLLRGEERMTLRLPEKGRLGQPGAIARFAGVRTAPSERSPEVADTDGMPPPEPGSFKPPPLSDGATLARAFSLRPALVNGERGARIMGTGINSHTLAALGLAPGDVILQIDGVPIGTRKTPDLGETLKQGGATLVVDRNGEETSVSIDASAAASAAAAYRQAAPDL